MTLRTHSETLETKGLSLAEMVQFSTDCSSLCWDKTERVVENTSRAPRGWEYIFKSVAKERREEDYSKCTSVCALVQKACPEPSRIEKYEHLIAEKRRFQGRQVPEGVPTIQEISRCEHTVELFAQLLFSLAHKPTKVAFEVNSGQEDPSPPCGGAPTEAHRKVLEGSARNIEEEIAKRWKRNRIDPSASILQNVDSGNPVSTDCSPKQGGTRPTW